MGHQVGSLGAGAAVVTPIEEKSADPPRYAYAALLEFAIALGRKVGLNADFARAQADILLEADLMGHTTHGLNLLPNFLKEAQTGALKTSGEPIVIADRGNAVLWDGNKLPGTWLVTRAIDEGLSRISQHAVVTYVIHRSGHVGALSPYLYRASKAGFVITLMTTNPNMRTVVPAGGMEPLLAPNPIGFGYPTERDPVLIDISTSAVANGWVRRWTNEKRRLPEKWLQDSQGNLTDDPSALFGPPPGASLPLGGPALSHKGFALGLIVETLTAGLSGVGHSKAPSEAGNLVYMQLLDPDAFAGRDAVRTDTGRLADACRSSRPRPGVTAVRMPGDSAIARRTAQLADGVELYPSIMPELQKWAMATGVTAPAPVA